MRSARLCASLGIAAVLLAPATALADPAPLPKPATVSPLPKPTQTPVTPQQPVTHTPVTQAPVTQTRVTPTRTVTTTITQTPVVPLITSGGREQPVVPPATLTGGRKDAPSTPTTVKQTATVKQSAATAELFPTRLSSVGDEALPSYDAWPSWVLGAFTLLASAAAFLLVRLARNRRFAQGDALRPY
jgi:hypothetical protein